MTRDRWQATQEMAKQHEQEASAWLKLQNDGDKAVIVFLGDPFPREVCFVDGKYMPVDDSLKAQGHKPTLRVAINVALYDTKEVKVFEQGLTFFKDLVRVRDKYGLTKWAFEVSRHGAARDLKTSYSILPEHQLSAEQQKAFQELKLHDLEDLYSGSDDDGEPSAEPSPPAEGAKVDPTQAQTIATQLKTMPREAVERFCQKFGVARIKDLPAAELAKAMAFVQELTTEYAPPGAEAPVEVDPFA